MITAPKQPLDASQQAALAALFSSRIVHEASRKGKSPLFSRLAKESGLTEGVDLEEPVRELFDTAFSLLRKKAYRNEYVYKAAITHKILLGKHSLQTSSMLTEFRVGACKADVVILNGTSTAYEIKSERDKLDRLESQVTAYRQAFAAVNVITGENHLEAVLDTVPNDVGVLVLTKSYNISSRGGREAVINPGRIVPSVLFGSLQLHESRQILELLDVTIPKVPNTQIYQVLHELFVNLDPLKTHAAMLEVLKATRSLSSLSILSESLPNSLRPAILSTSIRKSGHKNLLQVMNTPLREAMKWG